MNNCCPSYATKALHLANEQSWMIENPNRPVYMCFAIIKCGYFSPEVKKPQSSLYWDYIPFFVVCNYQKTSSSSTSNRMKEAKTEGKRWPNLVFVPTGQKYEAQTPGKNLEGRPICSLHKKRQFLPPAKGCSKKKNSFAQHQECIHKIRIPCTWHRKPGNKMDDATGELSSNGKENVIHYFECVLLHSLPSVPSTAFDHRHKPFLF